MPTTLQHIPHSLDPQETSSEEKPQAILTAQGVTRRPFWEVIVEISEQIPDEEWAKVPSDASINYQHYLYGVPKKRVNAIFRKEERQKENHLGSRITSQQVFAPAPDETFDPSVRSDRLWRNTFATPFYGMYIPTPLHGNLICMSHLPCSHHFHQRAI